MGCTKEEKDGYILVKQENGAELGYSPQSGARLIEQDGFLFKDLTGGGQLLPGRPILGILQTTRGALLQRIICAISLLP